MGMIPNPSENSLPKKDPLTAKGRVPLGYKLESRGFVKVRVVDEETAYLIREAKRLHAEGCSIRKTLKIVTNMGLRSRKGRRLTPMDLWRLLAK